MIPLKYNTRNLRVRWVTTLMTVLSTGLVVWASCLVFGLVDGLQHSLAVSGEPNDLIVVRQGSDNEVNSGIEYDAAIPLRNIDGVARDAAGQPLASLELVTIPSAQRVDGGRANLIFRGIEIPSDAEMTPVAQQLRPDFRIVAGRGLKGGLSECLVSKSLSGRFRGTRLGETLTISEKEGYEVVGIFTAGGSAAESEVWVDLGILQQNSFREGTISSAQIRAASTDDLRSIRDEIQNDPRFKFDAIPEPEYYAKQTTAVNLLKFSGMAIALLLTVGAMFAAANTMYAAVSNRMREIGTMRALGFSRGSILTCFLLESLLLCSLGGMLGILAALPFTGLTFSTVNNFSEATFAFRFGPTVLGAAFAMTLAMGLIGGLFPALKAIRVDVISALREL